MTVANLNEPKTVPLTPIPARPGVYLAWRRDSSGKNIGKPSNIVIVSGKIPFLTINAFDCHPPGTHIWPSKLDKIEYFWLVEELHIYEPEA